MRRGEILSLKWDQVDFLAGTIRPTGSALKNSYFEIEDRPRIGIFVVLLRSYLIYSRP
jgi:integrase